MKICQTPFTLLSPHYCEVTAVAKEATLSEIDRLLEMESQIAQRLDVRMTNSAPLIDRSNGL